MCRRGHNPGSKPDARCQADLQRRAAIAKIAAGGGAVPDPVEPEMPEILPEFAIGGEDHRVDIVDERERQDRALGRLAFRVAVGQREPPFVADRAAEHRGIGPRRPAARCQPETASVAADLQRLGGGDLGGDARSAASMRPRSPVRGRRARPTMIASVSSGVKLRGGRSKPGRRI